MRPSERVLVIGLDGAEITYAEKLMAAGHLPNLAALRDRSAAFRLENPPEARIGLEWEQFSSAEPPRLSGRESVFSFDPATYEVHQEGARFAPFLEGLDARTVVLDLPYGRLDRAPSVRGVVGWGSHDAGVVTASRPTSLIDDIGPYPSSGATYALPWPSAARCRKMGDELVAGLRARGDAAARLLTELESDWEVFVVVAGELHSAFEALWHGVDERHPLHDHPSADAARVALDDTHRAVDGFVGRLLDLAGDDVTVVAFNMDGMGPNGSDVPTMVLLPELLHRWAYGTALLTPRPDWAQEPGGIPLLGDDESWTTAVNAQLPPSRWTTDPRRLLRRLPEPAKRALRRAQRAVAAPPPPPGTTLRSSVWQPAARYARRWAGMDAFALPSYRGGRVRVNLEGRERHGSVPPSRFDAVLDEVEELLLACRDPRTGDGVVAGLERPSGSDPLLAATDHADLVVHWKGIVAALEHPVHGLVGPVPFRGTGGHTGPHGFAFVSGPGIEPHDYRDRSVFDVAPTVAALAGSPAAGGKGGRPLIDLADRAGHSPA